MGWEEELFAVLDELEDQAAALYAAELELEVADRSRAEYQQVRLAGRLMATTGSPVSLGVAGVGSVEGRLARVTASWCLVESPACDWVVPLDAVASVVGASARAVPEVAWPAVARLGLASALRRLAEEQERCLLHRRDGARHDGVPRRVGGDFVEVHEGLDRLTLVAYAHLGAVQSRR